MDKSFYKFCDITKAIFVYFDFIVTSC